MPEGAGLVAGPDRSQAGQASEPTGPKAGPGREHGRRTATAAAAFNGTVNGGEDAREGAGMREKVKSEGMSSPATWWRGWRDGERTNGDAKELDNGGRRQRGNGWRRRIRASRLDSLAGEVEEGTLELPVSLDLRGVVLDAGDERGNRRHGKSSRGSTRGR